MWSLSRVAESPEGAALAAEDEVGAAARLLPIVDAVVVDATCLMLHAARLTIRRSSLATGDAKIGRANARTGRRVVKSMLILLFDSDMDK